MLFNFGLILGFTLLFSFGSSKYLCNRTGETWDDAIRHCNFVGGTLLTADHIKDIDLSELIKENITEFWTPNIIEVAYAVEYKGCYVYSSSAPQNHYIPFGGEINLVGCQSSCDYNSYNLYPLYGLYRNNCTCINGEKVQLSLSNQSCFKSCRIDTLESCTDTNLIALYKMTNITRKIKMTGNFTTNKCVVYVNSTTESTENCQKNLKYYCNGTTQNGTFLDALEKCGYEWASNKEYTNSLDYSWRPVFFPTSNKIKNKIGYEANRVKMKICISLKMENDQVQSKERNCSDLLPYICKSGDGNTTSKYLDTCSFIHLRPSTNITTPAFSTQTIIMNKSNHIMHPSTMSNTGVNFTEQFSGSLKAKTYIMSNKSTSSVNTHLTQTDIESSVASSTFSDDPSKTNIHIYSTDSGLSSYGTDNTNTKVKTSVDVDVSKDRTTSNVHLASREPFTLSTDIESEHHTNEHEESKTGLVIGLTCGAVAIVFTIIIIIIVRKRCKNVEKNKEKSLTLDVVHFNPITDNQEGPDILHNESAALYSVAVPVNTAPVSNQTHAFYAVVNKTNDTNNQNEDSSLATPVSSAIQSGNNGDISGMYAVVTKVKKETTNKKTSKDAGNPLPDVSDFFTGNYDNSSMNTEAEKHTGNNQGNVSVESEGRKGSGTSYSLSAGSDYDHLDLSGNTGVLPVESDALYDHASPGNNGTDDMYDSTQHNIKQHGLNDTYDHFTAL